MSDSNSSYFGLRLGEALSSGAGHISEALRRKYEMQYKEDMLNKERDIVRGERRGEILAGAGYDNTPEGFQQYLSDKQKERALKEQKTQAEIELMGTRGQSLASGGNLFNAQLSPEATALLGDVFVRTGKVPSLGMGAAGMRKQVFEAAAKQQGLGPAGPLVENQAQYASDAAALKKLQTTADMTMSFEKQASRNFDLAESIAEKLDYQGNNILNRWYRNKVRGEFAGDEDVRNLNLAVNAAVTEYAKVVGGAAMSVAELSATADAKMQSLVDKSQSLSSFKKQLTTMRQEMENRKLSYEDQIRETKSRLGRGSATSQMEPVSTGWTPEKEQRLQELRAKQGR